LPPYYRNLGKRIVKSPKVYFFDTGLVSFLVGIDSKREYEKGPMHGPLFENYVVSEVLKRELHRTTKSELYYYRTNHGVEVDLIVDRKSSKDILEVKANETFRPQMLRSIEQVRGEKDAGYLIYPGRSAKYSDVAKVLNYHEFLGK
jgi:predicted AAA+ superfamily ATPase